MTTPSRHPTSFGFSLLETLLAVAITVVLGAGVFQIFFGNERLYRDQELRMEMEQSARVVIAQVADDIRLAGQGIPPGVSGVILPGTSSHRLNVRSGFSALQATVTSPLPISPTMGAALPLTVDTTTGFSPLKSVYLWQDQKWVRATVDTVSGASRTLTLVPSAASESPVSFNHAPTLSPDEAVAIYWDAGSASVRRTTSTNTTDPQSPAWAPANELAANVVDLTFFYYDPSGLPVDPAADPDHVHAIEAHATTRVARPLSNGDRPELSVRVRSVPRNLAFR